MIIMTVTGVLDGPDEHKQRGDNGFMSEKVLGSMNGNSKCSEHTLTYSAA